MEKILEKVEEGREEQLDLADVRITVLSILVKTTALIYLCHLCVAFFCIRVIVFVHSSLCIHPYFIACNICEVEYVHL